MEADVLGHVRGRTTFALLHRTGQRVRSGPFVATLGPPAGAPAVAFAIRTDVGCAVRRNRLRRRLRALLVERVERLPSVNMIVRPHPAAATLSYRRLAVAVDRLIIDLASSQGVESVNGAAVPAHD